jgi:dipeptidyl aminopeptidase/acylaminoacyl peptidase
MRRSTRVGRTLAVALVAASWVLAASSVAPAAGAPPIIAYSGTADELDQVWTARLDGTIAERFTHPADYGEPWTSIGGGLVAVTKHRTDRFFASGVHLYDARTGEERFTIGDARYPLVVWGGTGVMFLPDNLGTNRPNERDPSSRSVWFKDLMTGKEVRLMQVENPDFSVGQLAASPTEDLLAFTETNETFLFERNILLVRPGGGGLRYLTTDGESYSPSFSPDGRTVAMQKDGPDVCTGGLATKQINGTGLDRFFRNTCEMRLSRPIWIDDQRVVAQWRQPRPAGGFSVERGLVIVDTRTGDVSAPFVEGRVTSYAVSRVRDLIAYRTVRGAIGVYDIASGQVTGVPGGRRLPGTYLHLDGALELSP